MNTDELETYMLNDPYISQMYGGVVALNEVPNVIKKPSVFIVNSDPNYLPGTHWYALYFDRISEHFDSAGFEPNPVLENHLIVHGPQYKYNSTRVQNFNTDTCGLFCLFFVYFRCRGYTFNKIMNMFSNNLELNEHIVKYFYEITA